MQGAYCNFKHCINTIPHITFIYFNYYNIDDVNTQKLFSLLMFQKCLSFSVLIYLFMNLNRTRCNFQAITINQSLSANENK